MARSKSKLRKNDIIIFFTGLTGSGKSGFINTLLEKERMTVGETLASCTTEIDYEIIDPIPGDNSRGHCLVIVDTPGLNNRAVTDTDNDILHDIAVNALLEVPEVAGIIYIYDISREKYTSIAKIDLAALRASFRGSEKAFERVTLVTTKWGMLGTSKVLDAVARENELKTDLIKSGSQMKRFENSPRSAWEIVDVLLNHAGKDIGLNTQSGVAKIRTNLDAHKKNGGSKDALFVLPYSNFGSFSRGIGNKRW